MKHLFYGASIAAACGLFGGAALKMEQANAAPEAVNQPLDPVPVNAEMDSTGSYYLSPPAIPINASVDGLAAEDFNDPAEQLLKRAAFDPDDVYTDPAPVALDPADPIPAATGMTTPAVRPEKTQPVPPSLGGGETYPTIDDLVAAVSGDATPS